jgi:tetratricopeptide (TPR) repeat protein
VNEVTPATPDQSGLTGPVFISYATADRKQALSVCKAIERRGTACWISSRDVAPGENYQEAIVRSIRTARTMVLVFSDAANNSDEIKKELSLASRYRVPVMALRIEDVEPSDAFAYELSTRQWIDGFEGWDRSIDSLVTRIGQVSGERVAADMAAQRAPRAPRAVSRRWIWSAAAGSLLLLAIIAGGWWLLRPSQPVANSMTVRLPGFKTLSADLPAKMKETVSSEITAAFSADGVIGVSTASAPPPGTAPAYALDGTIDRIGDSIRVITRLTNERSGAVLWSDSKDYPADQVSRIPRLIGVDAGTVVRCGLFGASTYRKPLPDNALKDYLLYCQQYWSFGGNKTLVSAQRVVAAVPDFSWGWSAVANGFMQTAALATDRRLADEARAGGRKAADKAIALDRNNSEALSHKTMLIDPRDWIQKESLLKRAIAAQPLDCDCEHYIYGEMLASVGRIGDAIEQFRHSTDRLALWPSSQLSLAEVLVANDKSEEARSHFDAAIDLTPDSDFDKWLAVKEGTDTGDYAAALKALHDPQFQLSEKSRAALTSGYEALASGGSQAKAVAVRNLLMLPKDEQNSNVARMLAALGAMHEALQIASQVAVMAPHGAKIFWQRSMRGVLDDPGFPAVAGQLGLLAYWKTSHIKPDVCLTKSAPTFCRSI